MKIGFDAKRAFLNHSGLGNYSRFVLNSLFKYQPGNTFYLFTPKTNPDLFNPFSNSEIVTPKSATGKLFKSYWRSFLSLKEISSLGISLYHGLSGEIPFGIERTNVKSVVTIHDLIFLRHPEWYRFFDRKVYYRKALNACLTADKIIAISQQTKNDIIDFLKIPGEKIVVVYQGCNERFMQKVSEAESVRVQNKFKLPSEYILYVGTVEERKNLLSVVRAIHEGSIDIPLVIVGRQTNYTKKVKDYISDNKIKHIYFLEKVSDEDLPALYQNSALFVYPSLFEGFGIPILEALYSGTPVITSKEGCFREAGGPSSLYIDPLNPGEIADSIKKILVDSAYRKKIVDDGYAYTRNFDHEKLANELYTIYKSV